MHLIYALLAMMLLALFSLTTQRGIHSSRNDIVLNEVATEMTSVMADVFGFAERLPFDEYTDEVKKAAVDPNFTYPVITSTTQLTPKGSGSTGVGEFGGCTDLVLVNPTCDDLDDLDGLETTVEVDGLTFDVELTVDYVDPTNPGTTTSTRTYAKQLTVTISNPHLTINGSPLQVDQYRLFTYNRHT